VLFDFCHWNFQVKFHKSLFHGFEMELSETAQPVVEVAGAAVEAELACEHWAY